MKGRIKNYNEQKGFGFILGDDDCDYFFHISDLDTFNPLSRGDFVEFVPSENKKGQCAKKVKVSSKFQSAKFVRIGNENIRVSNIKSYGIASSVNNASLPRPSLPRCCFYEITLEEKSEEKSFLHELLFGSYSTESDVKNVFLIYPDGNGNFNKNLPYSEGSECKECGEYYGRKVKKCRLVDSKCYYKVTLKQNDKCTFGGKSFFHGYATKSFNEYPDKTGHFKTDLPYACGKLLSDGEVVSCELIEVEEKIETYLYVTTYQGDNYRFYDDIDRYKAMLDNLLK